MVLMTPPAAAQVRAAQTISELSADLRLTVAASAFHWRIREAVACVGRVAVAWGWWRVGGGHEALCCARRDIRSKSRYDEKRKCEHLLSKPGL